MASVTCAQEPVLFNFASMRCEDLAGGKSHPLHEREKASACTVMVITAPWQVQSTQRAVPSHSQEGTVRSEYKYNSSGKTTTAKGSTSPGARGCAGPRQCTCVKPVLASCTASSHLPSPMKGRCRFVGSNCRQAESGLPREATKKASRDKGKSMSP